MNNTKCSNALFCQRKFVASVTYFLFFIVAGIFLSFEGMNGTWLSNLVNLILFLLFFTMGLASSPRSLTICDEGIYIESLGTKKFLSWTDINWVKQYQYYTIVSAKNLTIFHWLLGVLLLDFKPIFTFSKSSHKNYAQAIECLHRKSVTTFQRR